MSLTKEQLEEFGQSKRDFINKIKELKVRVKLLEEENEELKEKKRDMDSRTWGR